VPPLDAELDVVKPKVVVCLRATAAQALLGRAFRVKREPGKLIASAFAPHLMATAHPSSILRAPDGDEREKQRAAFVHDLKKTAGLIVT
jgi:uracil-DNA glycosylase family 4